MQMTTTWIIEWLTHCDSILMDYLYTLQLNLNSSHLTFSETSYRVNFKITLFRREWILHSVQIIWKHRVKIINKMLTPNSIWCSNQDRAWKKMSLIMANLWNHWKHNTILRCHYSVVNQHISYIIQLNIECDTLCALASNICIRH